MLRSCLTTENDPNQMHILINITWHLCDNWFVYKKVVMLHFLISWVIHVTELFDSGKENKYPNWTLFLSNVMLRLLNDFFVYKKGIILHFPISWLIVSLKIGLNSQNDPNGILFWFNVYDTLMMTQISF